MAAIRLPLGDHYDMILLACQNAIQAISDASGNFSQSVSDLQTALAEHIAHDADIYQSMYAYMDSKLTNPTYDMENPTVVVGNGGLLSLLSSPQDWSAPSQGLVRIIYKAVLGVAPVVTKNGDAVSGSISLLGTGTPTDIPCVQGDVFAFSGVLGLLDSFTVYFYPSI